MTRLGPAASASRRPGARHEPFSIGARIAHGSRYDDTTTPRGSRCAERMVDTPASDGRSADDARARGERPAGAGSSTSSTWRATPSSRPTPAACSPNGTGSPRSSSGGRATRCSAGPSPSSSSRERPRPPSCTSSSRWARRCAAWGGRGRASCDLLHREGYEVEVLGSAYIVGLRRRPAHRWLPLRPGRGQGGRRGPRPRLSARLAHRACPTARCSPTASPTPWPRGRARRDRSPCSSSTSTASRPSTTGSATRSATRSWWPWPSASKRPTARPRSSPGWAATSSSSSSTVTTPKATPWRTPQRALHALCDSHSRRATTRCSSPPASAWPAPVAGVNEATPLLSNADAAMYQAKRRGGGTVEVFGEVMRMRVLDRMNTEHSLHRALERQRAPPLLPAGGGDQRLPGGGGRGPVALGAPRAGAGGAEPVHPRGRGERAHHPHRRLGAARGVPAAVHVAGRPSRWAPAARWRSTCRPGRSTTPRSSRRWSGSSRTPACRPPT